ncbi:MAG: hypothetical protein ACOCVF_03225 [bacterium]
MSNLFKNLKSVSIVSTSQIENSCANSGQNTLDNENELKMVDNHLELSGQSIRAQIREYVKKNYEFSPDEYFTEPDTAGENSKNGKPDIKADVRVDIFGTMIPKPKYIRLSPLQVSSAIAINESTIKRDMLVNFNKNSDSQNNNIVTKNVSEKDEMLFNYNIRVRDILSEDKSTVKDDRLVIENHDYDSENTLRKKRVAIILEAIRYLTGFANQSRNLIDVTPDKILVIFNFKNSDLSFMNYWKDDEITKKNKLEELNSSDHLVHFIGDNNTENSAYVAWKEAYKFLSELK